MLKITVKELGIYFVNCYLIHEENSKSCVAIDPGGNADKVIKFLEENGLTLEAILLTHGHFDHVGAVKDLHEKTLCKVYLHTDDLMLPENFTSGSLFYTHEYDEGDVLELAGLTIKVWHTPGHTEGSVCLFVDDVPMNVAGAMRLGINGYVFRGDAALLRSEIIRMGKRSTL